MRALIAFVLLALAAAVLLIASLPLQWWNTDPDELERRYTRIESTFADIGGVRLHYYDEGRGEPVVLLHGHLGNLRMWDGWVRALTPEYRLIRFDIPGYGLSGIDPGNDYSTARGVELLLGLADHLEIGRFHLVGTSFAGVIAFHAAAEFPERVATLTLMNSGGLPRTSDDDPNRPDGNMLRRWVYCYYHPRSYYAHALGLLAVNQSIVSDRLIDEYFAMNERRGRNAEGWQRLAQYSSAGVKKTLAKVTVPVLLQWAGGSPLLPAAQADRFAEWLVNAPLRKIVYPDTGHLLPLEAAAATAADAREVFQQWPIAGKTRITESADGAEIVYDAVGAGSTALILIHGWAGQRQFWDGQMNECPAGIRCIALDLAGHGDSEPRADEWSMAAFGADIAAVANAEAAKRLIVAGHSLGGPAMIEAAALLGERVIGLIGVDTMKRLEAPPAEQVDAFYHAMEKDFAGTVENVVRTQMFVPASPQTVVNRVAGVMSGMNPDYGIAAQKTLGDFNPEAALGDLTVPLVLINSSARPTDIERLQTLADIRLVEIAGTGHFPMLERPAEFNTVFFDTVAALAQ